MLDATTIARLSAWPVLFCYTTSIALRLSCSCNRSRRWIRGLWTAGWMVLLLHIALALRFFHGGSWQAAYEHTARRTQLAVGWNWGGGVWFNLLTAVVWGVDLIWLWRQPADSRRQSLWLDTCCQIYLAFMMFNATVVFGSPPARIIGGLICIGLAVIAMRARSTARHDSLTRIEPAGIQIVHEK